MNRSIQREESFASVKEDMEFRRYIYRGKENVTAQRNKGGRSNDLKILTATISFIAKCPMKGLAPHAAYFLK